MADDTDDFFDDTGLGLDSSFLLLDFFASFITGAIAFFMGYYAILISDPNDIKTYLIGSAWFTFLTIRYIYIAISNDNLRWHIRQHLTSTTTKGEPTP